MLVRLKSAKAYRKKPFQILLICGFLMPAALWPLEARDLQVADLLGGTPVASRLLKLSLPRVLGRPLAKIELPVFSVEARRQRAREA